MGCQRQDHPDLPPGLREHPQFGLGSHPGLQHLPNLIATIAAILLIDEEIDKITGQHLLGVYPVEVSTARLTQYSLPVGSIQPSMAPPDSAANRK
jgi:hypothetical protein